MAVEIPEVWTASRSIPLGCLEPGDGFPPPITAATIQPSVEDLVLTSVAGTAIPALLRRCVTGEHIKQGVLTVHRVGASAPKHLYRCTDILVTRIKQGSDSNGPAAGAHLSISMNFSSVSVFRYPHHEGGEAAQPVTLRWDSANKAVIA